MEKKSFDILIIGGGVAGMSAAIYAKRRNKNVVIVEKFALGGQALALSRIENFPSQTEIDGYSLAQMFSKQIKQLGIEILNDEIEKIDFSGDIKILTGKKCQYESKSVIIATGLSSVELGKNEMEYFGRGVSFCAVCDANFYKGQTVCVASKNGSGVKAALELANVCSKVIVLDSGDLSNYAKANKNDKIEIFSDVVIEEIEGKETVQDVVIKIGEERRKIETSALFIELGKCPKTNLFKNVLELDANGFIVTDEHMRTSVNGVFAVGDVRNGVLKQIVTACNDGAIAGQLA